MAVQVRSRKHQSGEPNKSEAIRQLLTQNPEMEATEVIDTLKAKGIKVNPSLFYFTKRDLVAKVGVGQHWTPS